MSTQKSRLTPQQERELRDAVLACRRIQEQLELLTGDYGWDKELRTGNLGYTVKDAAETMAECTEELERQAGRLKRTAHRLLGQVLSTTGNT